MPKAARKRIANRGQVDVSANAGSPNVPAAVRASARAPSGGSYVAPNNFSGSAWASMSGTFRELARQAEKQEDRAYAEAQKQEARAYAESKYQQQQAERREEAKLLALQSAAGLDAALQFTNTALEKVNSGAYSNSQEMLADFQASLTGLDAEHTSFIESYTRTAGGVVGPLSRDLANKLDARTSDNLMGTVAQSQRRIYENLDNLTTEQFVDHHKQLLADGLASGRPQHAIEDAMVSAFANEYGEAARVDAERASKLYDMGKEWSKSLTSRSALDKLSQAYQNGLSLTVATAARQEEKAAIAEEKQRRADFASLAWEATRLDKPEAVLQQLATWDADPDALVTKLGPDLAYKLMQDVRTHQSWLENREERDWQLKEAEGKRAMGEYAQRLFTGQELPTLQDLQNDERLLPIQVADMWQRVEEHKTIVDTRLAKTIEDEWLSLQTRIPGEAGWRGGYYVEDDAVRLDPKMGIHFLGRLKKAAFDAYRSVAPNDADSEATQTAAVLDALKATSDDILKNGYMAEVELESSTKERTGVLRPKVTQEVNVEAFPEQREDIEKALFSRKTGAAAVAYGPKGYTVSVDFDVKYYLGLPPDAKTLADEMLITRGWDEYLRRKEEFDNSSETYKRLYNLTHSNDPAILSRDRGIGYKAHKYDVDFRKLPQEKQPPQ